jgi:hypothetical protein
VRAIIDLDIYPNDDKEDQDKEEDDKEDDN